MVITGSHSRLIGLLGTVTLVALQPALEADTTILAGWDLLHTGFGTAFDPDGTAGLATPIPLIGVGLGNWDFGGLIGMKNVGNVDTIVRRQTDIVPVADPLSKDGLGHYANAFVFDAWQLKTRDPLPFFGGQDLYFTLQTERTAPEQVVWGVGGISSGTVGVSFGAEAPPGPPYPAPLYRNDPAASHGEFKVEFSMHFDIRVGALNGPIINDDPLFVASFGPSYDPSDPVHSLDGSATPWNHYPLLTDGPVIAGVNYLLQGTDQSQDFWMAVDGGMKHFTGDGILTHYARNPEPAQFATVAAFSLAGFSIYRRMRRS